MEYQKYVKKYYSPPPGCMDWTAREQIDKAPIWCSVDLRDGQQALVEMMDIDRKLEFFRLLVRLGFKEIEVGMPAASELDYQFIRRLIEEELIPPDVKIQVLTKTDQESIETTYAALQGIHCAIVHTYNPAAKFLCEKLLDIDAQEMIDQAVSATKMIRQMAMESGSRIIFEYTPEGFVGNEMETILALLNSVLDAWTPDPVHRAIINLPGTVEVFMPHVFASQVEYFHKKLHFREDVILSVHPHNDRGTAVSDAEMALLAGADRVEGTLFGNGERTGNVDIVTLALNMLSQGVDPELDLSSLMEIARSYQSLTKMEIPRRQPYAGDLVFSAFTASHQDAITKGMAYQRAHPQEKWRVPYLNLDPKDIGRTYDSDVIRITAQSGQNGIAYILKAQYGISLPNEMKADVTQMITSVSNLEHRELSNEFVYRLFEDSYIHNTEYFAVKEAHYRQLEDGILAEVTILKNQEEFKVTANGNGRLSAVSNAIKQYFDLSYELTFYEERSLSRGSSAKAITFVGISCHDNLYWGVGINEDIVEASTSALVAAVNQLPDISSAENCKDERILEIQNYIQMNYLTVTLDELSEHFFLSKPYLSKYIREKSGITFGETVKKVRMRKAKILLKNRNMTVESIAENVGYQNVEHFNRLFKKAYGMTPIQFRNQK